MKAPDLARLVFLAALWGGSFIFIRIAAPVLGPIVLVTLRVILAGSALLVYALVTRSDLELRARWRQYLILGALNSAIPFVLISTAELQLPASLAAILNATSPLFGAVIAAIGSRTTTRQKDRWPGARADRGRNTRRLEPDGIHPCGGACGRCVTAGRRLLRPGQRVHQGESRGSATDRDGDRQPVRRRAAALAVRAVLDARGSPSITVVFSVLALALLCTALAYLLYFRLIVDVGPAKALTVTFLVPIFGTLWGALFLGEQITISTMAGCGVVLAGTALVTGVRLGTGRRKAIASPD